MFRTKFKYYYYILIIWTLTSASLFGQEEGELIEQTLDPYTPFTVIQYSTKNGLPQNQVINITTDEKGQLILSTANGIVMFNGREFKTFIKGIDYKANRFRRLFWHNELKILSGIEYDGSFFCIYPIKQKIDGEIINNENVCDATLQGDMLWLYTTKGNIYQYEKGNRSFKKIIHVPSLRSRSMLYQHPYLYCATLDGLFKIHVLKKKYQLLDSTLHLSLLKTNPFDSVVYGISANKLFTITPDIKEVFDIQSKNANEICHDIEFTGPLSIFLGTSKGLYLIEPDYPERFTKNDGLPSNHIYSLYYNKTEDCLFVGTGQKGLLKLQLKSAYTFYNKHGLIESSLSSIIQTYDKKVLIAGNCCEIYQLSPDTVMPYSKVTAAFSSLAEIENIVYAGTWGKGLILLKDQQLYKEISTPDLPGHYVHSTFIDSKSNIWVGTNRGVAVGKNHGNFKPFFPDEIKGLIINIYELKNGAICLGGADGFYIIQNKRIIKKIGKSDGFVGKEVRSFFEDKEGKLWVGTYDGGVYCYHNDKLTSINKMQGCKLDNDAFCLAPDQFGYLLISSNHGLWRVSLNDLNDFYYGKLKYLIPFHYEQENGIYNPEFNGGFQNNFLVTENQHFYFPTIEGAVMVSPEELKFRKIYTSIDHVIVNDTLQVLDRHEFERNTHSIQFKFSSINYLNKYNVYYQHKLEGAQETDWSVPQKSNTVHLKMLPPGKYKFMVRAVDGFNDREPSVALFEFEIQPYFYETRIFKILALFFVISIITIVTVTRFNYIRRITEKREVARRQLAEFELKAIQSQMSPHFIFNCLNSIKYFVVSGQNESAEKFLDHFSLLIRKFLENSDVVEVTVAQEAAMLTEYLALEKMRMSNKMNFTVHFEPACASVIIPTMLTQPYVENAIKHGVAHLKRAGNIEVKFKHKEGRLVCTIDDDGIGRKKGMEISLKTRKHIPKGMSLVQEKSKILKELYNKDILIAIVDKVNENGESTGTQVIISIPT